MSLHAQAKELQLALRSGVHSSVAWSLNALTILSFNADPALLLSQHPGLLEALLEVQTGFGRCFQKALRCMRHTCCCT